MAVPDIHRARPGGSTLTIMSRDVAISWYQQNLAENQKYDGQNMTQK